MYNDHQKYILNLYELQVTYNNLILTMKDYNNFEKNNNIRNYNIQNTKTGKNYEFKIILDKNSYYDYLLKKSDYIFELLQLNNDFSLNLPDDKAKKLLNYNITKCIK
ncbi:MAG: hypothetical protein ACK5HL_03960 [Bacilli bacterium]